MSTEAPPTFGEQVFKKYFHACAFFRSREEEYRIMARFVSEALGEGQRVTYLVAPEHLARHKQRLEQAGLDLGQNGALLDVQSWGGGPISDGSFDIDRLLAMLEALFEDGRRAGFPRQRVFGQADWMYDHVPAPEVLLEYEARGNDIIARMKQPAMCCYQLDRMDARTMMDLLRAHPLAVVGGALYENPFYTPPAQMLAELRAQRKAL